MQHVRNLSLVVSVAVAGVGLCAGRAFGQVWSFDVNSPLDLNAEAFADEFSIPGGVTDAETTDFFVAGYQSHTQTYDWGNGVNPVAKDQPNPPGTPIVESSAAGMVGILGVGTNSLTIRWKTTTTLDCFAEGFSGMAWALASSSVQASIDGLTPFDDYILIYNWQLFAQAQTFHEGVDDDPEYAAGSLTFDLGGLGPGDVFNVQVDGDDPYLPDLLDLTGNGQISFTPAGTSVPLAAQVDAYAWAEFTIPATAGQDLAISEFVGEVKLTVVPEPGGAALLVMVGLLAVRRRR